MPSLEIPDLDVSRETLEKLHAFSDLTVKWTKSINLIANGTVEDIWDRHIRDSAQLLLVAPQGWKNWLDLGSGGGFPGIVISLMANSNQKVLLVESDVRKATFLRTVIRELDASAKVLNTRVEDVAPQIADVISARAVASLKNLVSLSCPFRNCHTVSIFPKGRQFATEIEDAHLNWQFEHDEVPSITDPDARILRLTRISERGS